MPLARFPIHFSYVLYLAEYSEKLALFYFRVAMKLCEWRRVRPSLLFHPLDFMGADDECEEVAFFPGMNRTSAQKIETLRSCMDIIYRRFDAITMAEFAQIINDRDDVRLAEPVTI